MAPGVHPATLEEVVTRLGGISRQRRLCTRRLSHVYELARRTGHLQRFVIFGSYVTAKPEPNDIDIVLVMADTFELSACPLEARGLFDHAVAQARYGASIFWIRPGLLIGETVDDFVASWQTKRDRGTRGIVEVV
jgi:hypothetical protein